MSDAANPSPVDDAQLFLGRQPILGRDQQLRAYELLFRNGSVASSAHTARGRRR